MSNNKLKPTLNFYYIDSNALIDFTEKNDLIYIVTIQEWEFIRLFLFSKIGSRFFEMIDKTILAGLQNIRFHIVEFILFLTWCV